MLLANFIFGAIFFGLLGMAGSAFKNKEYGRMALFIVGMIVAFLVMAIVKGIMRGKI